MDHMEILGSLFGQAVPFLIALSTAGIAAILLKHEGRPRSVILAVLFLGLVQAAWGSYSATRSAADLARTERLLGDAEESRSRLATALSMQSSQSAEDLADVSGLLYRAQQETQEQAERIGELRILLAEAVASRRAISTDLNAQSDRYNSDTERMGAQLSAAESEIRRLTENIAELNQLIVELGTENIALSQEVQQLTRQIAYQAQETAALRADGQTLLEENASLSREVSRARMLAQESVELLEDQERQRRRCARITGDENFRRINGC